MRDITPESAISEDDLPRMVLRLAHEIRNPLASMLSATQILEQLNPPTEETAEFYDCIHAEVDRIDRVVRDMQSFVRLESHLASSVRVAEAVAEAAELIADEMEREDVGIGIDGGPETVLHIDPPALQRALREIIGNAIRFSPEGERVGIGWRFHGERFVAIEVADRGPGIPDDEADRILRPFYSSSTQGTGLGLNIAARICHLAGGWIRWWNRDGGGACFALILPTE